MFDKLNPNNSESINSLSDEKNSGQVPIDDIDLIEDILKDGEDAEISIISDHKESRVEDNLGQQIIPLEDLANTLKTSSEKKTSENLIEVSRDKGVDRSISPKPFSKNEEKILKRLEENRTFKDKGSLKNKKGNEHIAEKPRSHLYIRNLDNSFTKEELHKIFYEEFERNHRFKINNIDIKHDRSSFLVKLSFEDIQNALDVLCKKDDFILPFKDKNKCIEPSETLEKYISECVPSFKSKTLDFNEKTSQEPEFKSKQNSYFNTSLHRNDNKSGLNTNDKRVNLDKETDIKKHSFDSSAKSKHENSQKSRRSRSRSRKISSSNSRSFSGNRSLIENKKYKQSYKKDYPQQRDSFIKKDSERKNHISEKNEFIVIDHSHEKFNRFETNNVKKEYNIEVMHNKMEKKENKGLFSSGFDNIRKPSNELAHSVTNFSRPNVSTDDGVHFRSCYFLGVPLNVQGNHIYQELQKRRIDFPDKFDIIKKSKNSLNKEEISQEFTYYSLIFREKSFVDTLLDEGFEVLNNPVLVLPSLPDKTLEEMVLYHQVFVYSLDNNLRSIYLLEELTNLYRFFTKFGKIVDFYLENFPDYFVITYVKHSSVLNLIRMDSIIYSSPSNFQYRLKVRKMEFKLHVRNTVDFNKTAYEKYMPFKVKQSERNFE